MAARQAVLGIDRGGFHFGVTKIFDNVSFLLDDARTALVGENGTGKSTLLKCLGGQLELNGGQVIRSRGLRVGTLTQDIPDGLADRPTDAAALLSARRHCRLRTDRLLGR